MNTFPMPPVLTELIAQALAEGVRRGEPSWMEARRREAFAHLQRTGFPTKRVESWKYTSVHELVETRFALPQPTAVADVRHLLPRRLEDECEIIFVDGRLAPEHSRLDPLAGVVVSEWDAGLRNGLGDRLRGHLCGAWPEDEAPFVALNRALSTGGVYIRVERGAVVSKRLHILFLNTGQQPRMVVAPRVVIEVEPQADVRIVQSHTGHPGSVSFTDAVTDLVVGAEARVAFTKVQAEAPDAFHYGAVRARLARGSRASLFDFTVGGKLARHDVYAQLDGEGAEVHLDGLSALKDRQHADHHTCVDHAAPRGTSRQVYKSILDGSARLVFNGRVVVRPGSSLTDGYQLNRHLLLSRSAVVNTKPELEIANDDVKCSHGASIGQIDDTQLFYLQSRGLDPVEAQAMLSRGFVEDVLYRIADKPLQDNLRALLGGFFAK